MDTLDHLQQRYRQLRHQLDLAYASRPWDSRHIDGITDQLVPLERALARHDAAAVGTGPQRLAMPPDAAAQAAGLS